MNTLVASLLALAFAGMAALSSAMDRHYEQLTRRRETPRLLRMGLRHTFLQKPILPRFIRS